MPEKISPQTIGKFQKEVLWFYRKHGRDLPWRNTTDPYHILVSEIMLQQTQVPRVQEKYGIFIRTFPDFESLDKAAFNKVYAVWQGLGYNRRVLHLKKISRLVVADHGGSLPAVFEELLRLPGIGKATAASILAFAFNRPVHFIETNIRTVFIHFFFTHKKQVSDAEILPLVEKTLYKKNPCVWFWALMDYGAMLKNRRDDKNRQSAQYKKQSKFEGSKRQVRGKILRLLLKFKTLNINEMKREINVEYRILKQIIADLHEEGFLFRKKTSYGLK